MTDFGFKIITEGVREEGIEHNIWNTDIERLIKKEAEKSNKKEWKFCPYCGERL